MIQISNTGECNRGLATNLFFLFSVFLGCLISVYDNVLNVIYFEVLYDNEKNWIAKDIINYGGEEFFITVKAIGTLLAAVIGICVVYTKYRVALIAVLYLQVLLFFYLTFTSAFANDNVPIHKEPFMEVIRFYLRMIY